MKENLSNLIGEKVAIHCNEEGQARRLIEKLRELDYEWILRGDETYWEIYGKRTGYFLDGDFGLQYGDLTEEGLQHGEVEIEKEKFRIIEFDNLVDFEEKTQTEPIKLKIVGIEEGKAFRFGSELGSKYMLQNGELMLYSPKRGWTKSALSLPDETIIEVDEIELTDTEKTILKGRYVEGYNWLAIDESDKKVFVYTTKPVLNNATGVWYGKTSEDKYSKVKHTGFKGIKTDKAYYIKDLLK